MFPGSGWIANPPLGVHIRRELYERIGSGSN